MCHIKTNFFVQRVINNIYNLKKTKFFVCEKKQEKFEYESNFEDSGKYL